MVASSAMLSSYSSVFRRPNKIGMNTGIDFLAENLLGTLDSQCGDLLAQALHVP
jgi:hypothetical protein